MTQGWWYRASRSQRMAQIEGAIECGLTQAQAARLLGAASKRTLGNWCNYHRITWTPWAANKTAGQNATSCRIVTSRASNKFANELDRLDRFAPRATNQTANPFDSYFDERGAAE